jgi:hypothetical protein
MKVSPIALQKALKGTSYPALKDDLVSTARGNAAPDEIVNVLQELPERRFDGPNQVTSAVAELGD